MLNRAYDQKAALWPPNLTAWITQTSNPDISEMAVRKKCSYQEFYFQIVWDKKQTLKEHLG